MTQDLFLITINKINIYISQLINLSSPVNNAVPSESHGIVLQLCIWRSESSFHPCKRKINTYLIRFLASLQTLSQSDPINPFVCGLSKNISMQIWRGTFHPGATTKGARRKMSLQTQRNQHTEKSRWLPQMNVILQLNTF